MEALTFHAFEVEEIKDNALDIVIPANRYSDAASHFGLAKILSAILKSKVQAPKYANLKRKTDSKKLSITIISREKCPRYSGLYAELGKIQSSPRWLVEVLTSCGLRPVNPVVDIMNYVMLEIGQPMHVFDADLVSGGIIVRPAREVEKITTLDGTELKLNASDLVIADEKRVLAVAGIKGGKTAEVNSRTKRIIIEAANFDPAGIYKTSRRLNLFTDASLRFSHGLSPSLVERGILRVAQLLKEVCGARIGDWVDLNYAKIGKKILKFDSQRFNRLTGLNLDEKFCLDCLKRLGFKIKGKLVEVPEERTDIEIFEDLAEEIVNLYGYNNLPASAPKVFLGFSAEEDLVLLKDKASKILAGLGLSEVYNYSFIGKSEIKFLDQPAVKNLVELENPISEDKKYLRPSLIPALMKNIEDNRRFYDAVRIFEIGRIFAKEKNKVAEKVSLTMAFGLKSKESFFELKGVLDQFLKSLGLIDFFFKDFEQGLRVEADHSVLGFLVFKENKAVAEIDFEKLLKLITEEKEYEPLSEYPSVVRDLSFWIDSSIRIDDILSEIQHGAPKFLDDVDLIDWYDPSSRGDAEIKEKKRSLTFRFIFNAKNRTLTDGEVGREIEKIVSVLQKQFGIEVR